MRTVNPFVHVASLTGRAPVPNPRNWKQLSWRNVYDPPGRDYRISGETLLETGGQSLSPGMVGVKIYRDVLASYRVHPEAKSLGPDGQPCTRRAVGLLSHRPVQALSIAHGRTCSKISQLA